MKAQGKKWVLITMMLSLILALSVSLGACSGEAQDDSSATQNQQTQQESEGSDEPTDDKLAQYNAGYEKIQENWTISNPDPLNYDYICEAMGDKGEWVVEDEETNTWVPLEGTPAAGEDATLRFSVEGNDGSVLVMWAAPKDYKTESISSISNTLNE